MRVTIKKIAEVAGVSRGTVDRALNDRTGVKEEVREKIKRIAKELGYKPNPAAKALADNRYTTKKIGILINAEGNPFFDEVMRGVMAALEKLEEFGMQSSLKTMKGYDVETQVKLLDELVEEQVGGIVLTPINTIEIAKKIDRLKEKGIEVITINTDVLGSSRMAYVGCQYKKSGTVAAGVMGMMNPGHPETYAIISSTRRNLAVERRVQGIVETLEKDFPMITVAEVLENQDSEEMSYELVKGLLGRMDGLDGICFAGAGCQGGIQAILDSGKKLKIVTYDLTPCTRQALKDNIVAATICQEPYKQGYEGVTMMQDYLLWNVRPKKEKHHTDVTIVTKYSI